MGWEVEHVFLTSRMDILNCFEEVPMTENENKSVEFLWNVHSYINEYIRFVDAKAGVVIVWTAGLLGVLVSAKKHEVVMNTNCQFITYEATGSAMAYLLLSVSFLCAVASISPRLTLNGLKEAVGHYWGRICGKKIQLPTGYIFWREVLAHSSDDEFVKSVRKLSEEEHISSLARHIRAISAVADRKMFWVDWSLRLAVVGSLFSAWVLVM